MNHLDVRGVLWVNDYKAAWMANKEVKTLWRHKLCMFNMSVYGKQLMDKFVA